MFLVLGLYRAGEWWTWLTRNLCATLRCTGTVMCTSDPLGRYTVHSHCTYCNHLYKDGSSLHPGSHHPRPCFKDEWRTAKGLKFEFGKCVIVYLWRILNPKFLFCGKLLNFWQKFRLGLVVDEKIRKTLFLYSSPRCQVVMNCEPTYNRCCRLLLPITIDSGPMMFSSQEWMLGTPGAPGCHGRVNYR